MNKTVMICTLVVVALAVNTVEAGTLNSGVSISPFFSAGGSANGNALIVQLKYQMAVDSLVGISDRYQTKTYYTSNYNTIYETGSNFTSISIDAAGTGVVSTETEFTD